MAINLTNYLRQYYEEDRQRRLREAQEREHLIPSEHLINEVIETDESQQESQNRIVQTYPPNYGTQNEASSELISVAQSSEEGNGDARITEKADTFNGFAAIVHACLYILPIMLYAYGMSHFDDCPADKRITISFVVIACLMLFSRVLSMPEDYRNIFKNGSKRELVPESLWRIGLNCLSQIATIFVYIALCCWIIYLHPDFTEGSSNYCDKHLFETTSNVCFFLMPFVGIFFFFIFYGLCRACFLVCDASQ